MFVPEIGAQQLLLEPRFLGFVSLKLLLLILLCEACQLLKLVRLSPLALFCLTSAPPPPYWALCDLGGKVGDVLVGVY